MIDKPGPPNSVEREAAFEPDVALEPDATGADAPGFVDLHSHVIPGVDDGACDVVEGLAALRAFRDEGVATVVATPHVRASLTEGSGRLEERLGHVDAALGELRAALERAELGIRLERGAEIKLDAPEPDLSDPRLRLAGTEFVLVEFAGFQVPPYAGRQLAALAAAGWRPILAHPERYAGAGEDLERLGAWREGGVRFQINCGSLAGVYGKRPRRTARALLARGWADYLASDYHALGEPGVEAVRRLLAETEEGEEAAGLLLRANPARLLEGREPLPVMPLELSGGLWSSVLEKLT